MQRAQRSGEVRAFKKRWGDEEEGADSSLQGRLEASKERWRDERAAVKLEPSRKDEEIRREQRVVYKGD